MINTKELKSILIQSKAKFLEIPEDKQREQSYWTGELPPQLSALKNFLEKTPGTKLFNNKYRVLENSSSLVNYDGLAKWLIFRAIKVGEDKTIKDLTHYMKTREVKYYQILSVSGIKIKSELQLSNDIRFVPFSTLPDSEYKKLLETGYHFGRLGLPSAALIREKLFVVKHQSKSDSFNQSENWREEFQDALLCLTVVEHVGISSVSSWLTIDDSVPLGPYNLGGASLSNVVFSSISPKIVDTTNNKLTKDTHREFTELKGKDKDKLRVAMSRLNSALLQHPNVNSAIDLRVAAESIFSQEEQGGEYTFKIRNRAARFLGKNLGLK